MDTEDEFIIKRKIRNEELGKIFEMAICLLYNIKFNGEYKYSIKKAYLLKNKIKKLKEIFPFNLKHTGKNTPYDFISIEFNSIKLNAKTSKKISKVCPQTIGQTTKKKFCEYFYISNIYDIKNYIIKNINDVLLSYIINTFQEPIIYYNENKNIILFIKMKECINIHKHKITFSHLKKNKKWNESTTISIGNISIGEFQIHNNRDCVKFRWCFEKILKLFSNNFEITKL